MEKVSGTVVHVLRFRGSEDNSGVLTIRDAVRKQQKVVGVTEGIEIGSFVHAEGKAVTHPVYGPQLRAQRIRVELPSSRLAAEEWFVRHFTMQLKDVREMLDDWYSNFAVAGTTHPGEDFEMTRLWSSLRSTTGAAKAIEMLFEKHDLSSVYPEVREYVLKKMAVDSLVEYGLTSKEALLLYKACGVDVLGKMAEDPYIAYLYVESIGFKKMDDIYLSQLKGKKNDDHRVRAMCVYFLNRDSSDHGHTAVEHADFIALMEEEHSFSATKVLYNLHRLIPEFVTQYGDPTMIQLSTLAEYEAGIAEWLATGKIETKDED